MLWGAGVRSAWIYVNRLMLFYVIDSLLHYQCSACLNSSFVLYQLFDLVLSMFCASQFTSQELGLMGLVGISLV